MTVSEFISQYRNHPILFIGTGISLRYLKNSYTWDGLLSKIAFDLTNNEEYYFDIKSKCESHGKFDYLEIAEILEVEFNTKLQGDRNGKFKHINDTFYRKMAEGKNLSRFKIYISELFSNLDFRDEKLDELKDLKKIRKNIGSIITTNYDGLIEHVFGFNKLIGNDILLSNPYGSVYKIHGCCEEPNKIIISNKDYIEFDIKFELIKAQLLSLFIHNPIIFLGYSVGDDNIKKLLKTIFTYVEPNTDLANNIKNNFLLVEYGNGVANEIISDHDIVLEDGLNIRINKIKTDNFSAIYEAISSLELPISAMDVRKVQGIVKQIYAGGDIKVSITEDLDSLKNGEKILAIGSEKTIRYFYQTAAEMLSNYFTIIEESNSQLLNLVDKYTIYSTQYFPIFGFDKINPHLQSSNRLKQQQRSNLSKCVKDIQDTCKKVHHSTEEVLSDASIPISYKINSIIWNTSEDNIPLENLEAFLRAYEKKDNSEYRKLLSIYDLKKYEN